MNMKVIFTVTSSLIKQWLKKKNKHFAAKVGRTALKVYNLKDRRAWLGRIQI